MIMSKEKRTVEAEDIITWIIVLALLAGTVAFFWVMATLSAH